MAKNLDEFFKKFSVKLDEDVSTDTPETPERSEEMDLDPRDPDDSNVTNTEVPNDENPNVTVTGGYKRLTKEEMDRLYAIKDPKTGKVTEQCKEIKKHKKLEVEDTKKK